VLKVPEMCEKSLMTYLLLTMVTFFIKKDENGYYNEYFDVRKVPDDLFK
jgi:hypothetical protein